MTDESVTAKDWTRNTFDLSRYKRDLERKAHAPRLTDPTSLYHKTRKILRIPSSAMRGTNYPESMPHYVAGVCYGGSIVSKGGARMLLNHPSLAIAADLFLISRRQLGVNASITLAKLPAFGAPAIFPAEGTIHALQIKKLAYKIIHETNPQAAKIINKIKFSKMDIKEYPDLEPYRTSFGVSTIPVNTEKTRDHLRSIFPQEYHPELNSILERTDIHFPGRNTFTQEGWWEILNLLFRQTNIE